MTKLRPGLAIRLAVALVASLTLTSVIEAQVAVPNQYATTLSGTQGLNTLIRDTGNSRTAQLLIDAAELAGIPAGSSITGITYRMYTGAAAAFPPTNATWADYTISVGPGVALGSASTTFASNFSGAASTVRSGPLTITAGTFTSGASPNAFGTYIPFTTPYVYPGGNLVIEIRHTGSDITNPAGSFLEAVDTTNPDYGVRYWSATATGAAATTGAMATFTVIRLDVVLVPVELFSFSAD